MEGVEVEAPLNNNNIMESVEAPIDNNSIIMDGTIAPENDAVVVPLNDYLAGAGVNIQRHRSQNEHLAAVVVPVKKSPSTSTESTSPSSNGCSVGTEEITLDRVEVVIDGTSHPRQSEDYYAEGEIPILTRTGDNLDLVIQYFYSSLEVGTEKVVETLVSPCATCAAKEEPAPTAMDLLGEDKDNVEETKERVQNEEGVQKEKQVPNEGTPIETTKNKEAQTALKAPAASDLVDDGGVACLTSVFSCQDEDRTPPPLEATDSRIHYLENTLSNPTYTLSEEGNDTFDSSDRHRVVKDKTFGTPVSDSSDDTRFVSNKTFDSETGEYVTTENKPFPWPSSVLRVGSAPQVVASVPFQNRRAAILAAEVETRRAELELRKIELESMKVERELQRQLEKGSHFDLNGDTFDSLDTRTIGSEESEEEDEGVEQVLDAFSIYSVCS